MGTVPVMHVFTTGEVVTASNLNNNTVTLAAFVLAVPYCKVRQTANQAISTGTALSWSTADVNSDSIWSAGAPTRLTSNTPGWYELSGKFECTTGITTGRRGTIPAVNGTQLNQMLLPGVQSSAGICPDFPIFLNATDYAELLAFSDVASSSTNSGTAIAQAWALLRWAHQ